MRILCIGAVEEGYRAFEAFMSRPEYYEDVAAIITLDDEETSNVSGLAPFEQLAQRFNKPCYKIKHIRTPEAYQLIKSLAPDLIMVIGWSQLVGDDVLLLPRLGCIGLHTTLLPRHRGRAPIPWAIIKGLGKSGNTLFYFTPGVDNGDIIAQKHFYITLSDTAASVYEKAARAGIDLILEYLPQIKAGTAPRIRQDESNADHWPKRRPKDGLIQWEQSSLEVHNLIRAVSDPYPGAFSYFRGRKLFIWSSDLLGSNEIEMEGEPGEILDKAVYENGLIVATGQGVLLLKEVQFEGEARLSAAAWMEQNSIEVGQVLESVPAFV